MRLLPRLRSTRRFGWLVWLALALPLAQAAAAWHAVSHAHRDAVVGGVGKQAVPQSPCDLCLAAAALGSAAPATVQAAFAVAAVDDDPPAARRRSGPSVRPSRAYYSRAPPFVSL